MNPQVGDVIRVVLTFANGSGGIFQNIFNLLITELILATWDDVGENIETYFDNLYSDWMAQVATSISSQLVEILLRDTVAGEWNTVYANSYTNLIGSAGQATSPLPNTATLIAYPATPRNWSRKGLPAPAEGALDDGILNGVALADALLTGTRWVQGITSGFALNAQTGVYSEEDELFRDFIGTFTATSTPGTQVTRKLGRGD